MVRNHAAGATVDDTPDRFFEAEYRLDYRIHTLPKPVVAFGCGFVMGGGLGLYSAGACPGGHAHDAHCDAGSDDRPVPGTRARPGFCVGCRRTWGLFLGATGTRMDAADALYAGLGTHFAPFDCDPAAALGGRGRRSGSRFRREPGGSSRAPCRRRSPRSVKPFPGFLSTERRLVPGWKR